MTKQPTVEFETTLTGFGKNTGIVVPPEALAALDAGKRPPVDVEVNGYRYRSTIGSMNGRALISVSAEVRKDTGLNAGDPISVILTLNETPRTVDVPDDFASALEANEGTAEFFAGLSNSLQRHHIDLITGAKTEETRQRRIDRAIGLFLDGKKR